MDHERLYRDSFKILCVKNENNNKYAIYNDKMYKIEWQVKIGKLNLKDTYANPSEMTPKPHVSVGVADLEFKKGCFRKMEGLTIESTYDYGITAFCPCYVKTKKKWQLIYLCFTLFFISPCIFVSKSHQTKTKI